MPMSEAALTGISIHGHRWKYRIDLKPMTEQLGHLNNRRKCERKEAPSEELEAIVDKIVERVRAFVKKRFDEHGTDDELGCSLDRCADDLEMIADEGLEAINDSMNRLYDDFDYYRVVAS